MVTDYHDWNSWVCDSQHAPHGYVHVWIGGMLNCDDTLNALASLVGKDNADSIKLSAMNRKSYWQKEMFECKGSAAEDTPVEEVCVCECVRAFLTLSRTSIVIPGNVGFALLYRCRVYQAYPCRPLRYFPHFSHVCLPMVPLDPCGIRNLIKPVRETYA